MFLSPDPATQVLNESEHSMPINAKKNNITTPNSGSKKGFKTKGFEVVLGKQSFLQSYNVSWSSRNSDKPEPKFPLLVRSLYICIYIYIYVYIYDSWKVCLKVVIKSEEKRNIKGWQRLLLQFPKLQQCISLLRDQFRLFHNIWRKPINGSYVTRRQQFFACSFKDKDLWEANMKLDKKHSFHTYLL